MAFIHHQALDIKSVAFFALALLHQYRNEPGTDYRVQALAHILCTVPCCHSNEIRAPIANPPNSAPLGAPPTISPSYIQVCEVVRECGDGQTDRQTDRQPWPLYISLRLRLTRNVKRY